MLYFKRQGRPVAPLFFYCFIVFHWCLMTFVKFELKIGLVIMMKFDACLNSGPNCLASTCSWPRWPNPYISELRGKDLWI